MLHHLFEEVAAQHPQEIALCYSNEEMTYEQLNVRSNQLAHELVFNGVAPYTNVAILMDRSFDMVIAILAVLKAGAAYVPIDPNYPKDRIAFIVEDSSTKIVLTNLKDRAQASNYGVSQIHVKDIFQQDESNLNVNQSEDALAYIIYTSGSTGNPKGVMVEHRNVISLLNAVKFSFSSSDVWSLFHSISFDFSVWELFCSLLTGATLVIVPEEARKNFRLYRRLLIERKVTIANQTPSAFYSFQMEELKHPDKQLSLTTVFFGGEKLEPMRLKEWKKRYPLTQLINMYGITETTVHVTHKKLGSENILSDASNIGVALAHLKIHLLNDAFLPVSNEEIGEIFVEGAGLARGYVNNPELTKEKFVEHPAISKNKLYRSGDLGRYLPNGEIEYIGRTDNQIKIRGYRIELEEIESKLKQYEGIQEVIVAAEAHGDSKVLIAFYTCEVDLDTTSISEFLLTKLPSYMVPSIFRRVEEFIKMGNGKVDRNRIFECKEFKNTNSQLSTEGMSLLQKRILDIITTCFVEGSGNITMSSEFSDVGLDSLTFIQVIVALEEAFDFEFDDEVLLITGFPTVRSMVEYVESKVT